MKSMSDATRCLYSVTCDEVSAWSTFAQAGLALIIGFGGWFLEWRKRKRAEQKAHQEKEDADRLRTANTSLLAANTGLQSILQTLDNGTLTLRSDIPAEQHFVVEQEGNKLVFRTTKSTANR